PLDGGRWVAGVDGAGACGAALWPAMGDATPTARPMTAALTRRRRHARQASVEIVTMGSPHALRCGRPGTPPEARAVGQCGAGRSGWRGRGLRRRDAGQVRRGAPGHDNLDGLEEHAQIEPRRHALDVVEVVPQL